MCTAEVFGGGVFGRSLELDEVVRVPWRLCISSFKRAMADVLAHTRLLALNLLL